MEPKSHPVTTVLLANTDFGNKNTWKVQTRHPNRLHAFPTPEDVTTQQIVIFDGNIPMTTCLVPFSFDCCFLSITNHEAMTANRMQFEIQAQ